ncbi:MAG TPA: hypothetical protein VFE05_10805 [Longimicrobiaceae bacterium]|jgi:hypothetical protein|nr:hypothetical protein [Longimicrobiaceae bacterium]
MTDETRTDQAKLTLQEALAALRDRAARAPGSWRGAEGEGAALTLEWNAAPGGLGAPEALRVTRRYVAPVADDLERIAAALPKSLEVGPLVFDPRARTLVLGLRPRSSRATAERCARCGASPRYGTRLFGDAQLCAVCSLYGESEGGGGSLTDERGSALIGALLVMLLLAMLIGGAMLNLEAAERTRGAHAESSVLDAAGSSVIETMTERLRSRAALRLGALDAADVAELNAGVATLPTVDGATVDPDGTGFRVVAVRELDPVPDDAQPLDIWTDQPRLRYSAIPRPQGQTASRTIEIEMRVHVVGASGGQRTLTQTAAIARVAPYQYALYRSGGTPAELCAVGGPATVVGPVRIDGLAFFAGCPAAVTLLGTLEARDGVQNDNPQSHILSEDGVLPLDTWSRAAAETGGSALLGASLGHVRVVPAAGGTFEASRRQDASVAGTGECADRAAACGGNGYFAPGISVQRTSVGAGPGWAVTCGQAYGFGTGCIPVVSGAMRYHPWPWAGAVPAGIALPDPADPSRLWKGLLFDPRREARCTATVAGHVYETHRCPSNVYGWVLDLGALPAVSGGMLYVRAASADPVGRFAAGAQEALVIRNAAHVAAPLTIVSDVPVFVVGSLNTVPAAAWRGPPPLMVDAPRVTLLPGEADVQLGLAPSTAGWASVWDLVPAQGETTASAVPLVASTNTTLYAVLRTDVCGRPGGVYQGGVVDQAPAVLGDWSGAEVRVVGAVEQTEVGNFTAGACAWSGNGYGTAVDGSPWRLPAARSILFDARLLYSGFVPPGSFLPVNVPPRGVLGAAQREPTRQARAGGGYGVMWLTQAAGSRQPRPTVALPGAGALPPSPPVVAR